MATIADTINAKVWLMREIRRRSPPMTWKIMNKEAEIKLVHDVITHPSGMHVQLMGILYVRPCEGQIYEVGFEPDIKSEECPYRYKTFTDPMEAAREFVKIRFAQELGIDIEMELSRPNETS